MKEKDPQSEFVRGIGMVLIMFLAAATLWAVDRSKRSHLKETVKINEKYEENRLQWIRNDLSRLHGKLHLKLRDYREVNNER